MCGISGELRFDGAPADIEVVQRMTRKLARRGPDHEGVTSCGPVALGHRRLAIIDLSPEANQPMQDHALGLTIVFNGTIYNYKDLRSELIAMGYQFRSTGDTEVILKSYYAWGESCVERFYGMFAFAIWDSTLQTLFLARDRFGIKPLYFSASNKRLRFASTPQALLASGAVDTSIDPTALHFHVALHAVVPAPRTLLNGIRKLGTATTMTVTRTGQISQRQYWSLNSTRPNESRSENQWLEATKETLIRSLERHRLAADVPVGVLLSGGLDSSLLVGLLSGRIENMMTFSIGFEDAVGGEEKGDEFIYSDQVAERFSTKHFKCTIPNQEVLRRLPEAMLNMAEPMASHDVVAFYLLSELVSGEVKVVLSGQGADEVFSGYSWYSRMNDSSGSDVGRFSNFYFDRGHSEYLEMVDPAYHVEDVSSAFVASELTKPRADEFLDQVWRLDITSLMTDGPVKRVDNMSMAWGVEARVPFLDHDLVELAARMPPALKLKNGGKYPLKAVARGLLPNGVIDRPKGYFPLPALKFVTGRYLELMREILNSEVCVSRGLYRRAYVENLLSAPETHLTPLNGNKLWQLAVLEWWLQLNVDGLGA